MVNSTFSSTSVVLFGMTGIDVMSSSEKTLPKKELRVSA